MFLRMRERERFSLCGFNWEENSKERGEPMEKSIHDLKVEFVCLLL